MISNRTTECLDRILSAALVDLCSFPDEERCVVAPLEGGQGTQIPSGQFQSVTCSIAAFDFRIVVFVTFVDAGTSVQLFRRRFHFPEQALDPEVMAEGGAEFINRACGTVKGALTPLFKHTGMSTPFFLDARCRMQVPEMHPDHARSFIVSSAGDPSPLIEVSYCVCSDPAQPLDFSIDVPDVVEDANAGELEFF